MQSVFHIVYFLSEIPSADRDAPPLPAWSVHTGCIQYDPDVQTGQFSDNFHDRSWYAPHLAKMLLLISIIRDGQRDVKLYWRNAADKYMKCIAFSGTMIYNKSIHTQKAGLSAGTVSVLSDHPAFCFILLYPSSSVTSIFRNSHGLSVSVQSFPESLVYPPIVSFSVI